MDLLPDRSTAATRSSRRRRRWDRRGTPSPTPPPWEGPASELLHAASQSIQLLSAVTPVNWTTELDALVADARRGRSRKHRFRYRAAPDHGELIDALLRLSDHLTDRGALADVYAARARELAVEAELCGAVGTAALRRLARQRYGPRDRFDAAADALCQEWLAEPPPAHIREASVMSDDPDDPHSLLNLLRAQVSAHGLEMQIVTSERLAALAATGGAVLYVAKRRRLSRRAAQRTALHEIHGHALPRARAARARLGIFAVGTAHGSDDQEGRALGIERDARLLDPWRCQELALRHCAARTVWAGASFVETAEELARHGVGLGERLRIAARVHRGGGLAREVIYLPAYLRVHAAQCRHPGIDVVLGAGRVAVEAAATLRQWA